MTARQYFQEKLFRKNFRNGFHMRVSFDNRDSLFEKNSTYSGPAGMNSWMWDSKGNHQLKPEIQEILQTCQPYRMIKNGQGHTDFYFMWETSLVRFKLSLDT